MGTVKAITLRPLNGAPAGTERELDQADFDRLAALGAVKAAPIPSNKMEQAPLNKADPGARKRKGGA